MYSIRPSAIIALFLIVAVLIPQSLFSQTAPRPSQASQPATPKRRPKRSQRADALAPAIKDLLEAYPLAPQSPGETASDGNAPEDEDKPPADDAPIKELVAYWSNHDGVGALEPKLSDKVRQRLLEACEDLPERIYSLMDCVPNNADTHDRLYKLLNEEPEGEETWKPGLRAWLRRNSAYFRDELIKTTREADDNIYLAKEDLLALARLDWNAARPVLETFATAGKAVLTPVAMTLLYEHAMRDGDSARAESYRAVLKAIVQNRQSDWNARVEVLASLLKAEWSGQEEWFISLFADTTLGGIQGDEIEDAAKSGDESGAKADAAKGETPRENVEIAIDDRWELRDGVIATALYGNTVLHENADRWLPVIGNLVGHDHRAVHKAALKCLIKFLINESGDEERRKEIARKIIPCLTEPGWVTKEDRAQLIARLIEFNMPEFAPGLIWILDYDEAPENRAAAANALAQYRDPRAIPALRRALEKEKVEWNRQMIVTALAECGGLSDDEMAVAVEAYARMVVTVEGEQEIEKARYIPDLDKPLSLQVSIGRILHESETIRGTEGLAVRLIERAVALRVTQPDVSRQILRTIEGAPLRVAELNLVERIGEGWADFDSVALALETRDTLMKGAGDELYRLIKQGGYAAGVAAAILKDEREWKSMLEGNDIKTQLALLAGARYLRDKLPVELVGRLLKSTNRELAKAAESYLEVEDSPEARKLVLARHPGEARVLGDLTAISNDDDNIESARKGEDALRKELRSRSAPEAIYAVFQTYLPGNADCVVIRVRGGKAEMSVQESVERRNVRWLTDGEFEELRALTSRQEIEDLGPESYFVGREKAWWKYEYLRLTKEGGRRIVLDGLLRAPKNPTPHEELSGLFYRLSRSGEFAARYTIEDKIPGVEVVLADKNQSVLKVCAEGGEIRALIEAKGGEYKRGGAKAPPEWREISSGRPGEVKDEPSACRKLDAPLSPPENATVIRPSPFGQPAQSDGALYYIKYGEAPGIVKAEPGTEPVKIASGVYYNPVVTPDGKWLVAVKLVNDAGKNLWQLTRRNLRSGEEFVVADPQNTSSYRLVYVPAHAKVLALNFGVYGKVSHSNLLDPETGTVQPVKGEFSHLAGDASRAPQSAGGPNLFWAAIYDSEKEATKFGRYDFKNFVFTSLLEFPELELNIDDIWVDTASNKIWFAYKEHLLRLPLPAQMK
jgi:hypothetical protein